VNILLHIHRIECSSRRSGELPCLESGTRHKYVVFVADEHVLFARTTQYVYDFDVCQFGVRCSLLVWPIHRAYAVPTCF
jgi:hypothetical protein